MKIKPIVIVLAVLVAATGLWLTRATWRMHRQLVSLHVRNAPLAEVLHSLERQTWQKIRFETNLDARITLNVTARPLASVLDRIADQAGARWTTVYAVYGSAHALPKLESALRGETKLEGIGWTKIAPSPLTLRTLGPDGQPLVQSSGPGPDAGGGDPALPPGVVVTGTDDVVVDRPGPGKDRQAANGPGPARRGPGMVRIVRRGGGDGNQMEEEVWTPEELVMESTLKSRLDGDHGDAATHEAAEQLAQKVRGRLTTYLAMSKSKLGMALGGMQPVIRRFKRGGAPEPGSGQGPGGANVDVSEKDMGPTEADLEQSMQQQRYDELGKLTPEQRVQRARERQKLNSK
jgi:hypothetical protein